MIDRCHFPPGSKTFKDWDSVGNFPQVRLESLPFTSNFRQKWNLSETQVVIFRCQPSWCRFWTRPPSRWPLPWEIQIRSQWIINGHSWKMLHLGFGEHCLVFNTAETKLFKCENMVVRCGWAAMMAIVMFAVYLQHCNLVHHFWMYHFLI